MVESPAPIGDARDRVMPRTRNTAEASADWLARVDRLAEFRDAGLLTDSELEEQMEKLRWGAIPGQAATLVDP
jgi:hypothetical protein